MLSAFPASLGPRGKRRVAGTAPAGGSWPGLVERPAIAQGGTVPVRSAGGTRRRRRGRALVAMKLEAQSWYGLLRASSLDLVVCRGGGRTGSWRVIHTVRVVGRPPPSPSSGVECCQGRAARTGRRRTPKSRRHSRAPPSFYITCITHPFYNLFLQSLFLQSLFFERFAFSLLRPPPYAILPPLQPAAFIQQSYASASSRYRAAKSSSTPTAPRPALRCRASSTPGSTAATKSLGVRARSKAPSA